MTPPRSPVRLHIDELLADGEWHDRELIVQTVMPLVPPGQAVRRAHQARERCRARQGHQPWTGAHGGTPPADDQTVGARSLIVGMLSTLTTARRVERRTFAGVVQIRRTPQKDTPT